MVRGVCVPVEEQLALLGGQLDAEAREGLDGLVARDVVDDLCRVDLVRRRGRGRGRGRGLGVRV